MAIEKTFVLKADTKDAQNNIDSLENSFDKLNKKSKDLEQQIKETLDPDKKNFLKKQLQDVNNELGKTDKAAKDAGKSAKGASGNIKLIGTALKATGIGLIIALFAKFGEALTKNKKVADFFSTAMEALGIVFSDLFDFIGDNFLPAFQKVKDFFANLTFDKIKKAITENITERFNSLLEVLGFVGTALRKLFEGDFKGALDAVKEAGKEMVDVYTGVDDTVGKVSGAVDKIVESVSEYTKETLKAAKANVELKNTAELAVAQQAFLLAKLDGQLEAQRKIRDDEGLSVNDRIKANNEILRLSEIQKKELKNQANLQIAAAKIDRDKYKGNIEFEKAYIDSLTNRQDVLNAIQAQEVEQSVNRVALEKERIELSNSLTDSEKARQILQLEFEASRETDPLKKLEAERLALEEEKLIEKERLDAKIAQFKEGTQARVDAEIELKNRMQEIGNEIILNADEQAKKEIEIASEKSKKEIQIEEERSKYIEQQYKDNYSNLQTILSSGGEKLQKISKALAIADVARTAFQSISSTISNIGIANAKAAAASPLTAGMPFVAINTLKGALSIGSTIASSAKSIQAITSNSKNPSGGGAGSLGAGGGGAGGGQSAPSFNVVGNSGASQLGQTLNQEQNPVQAFVVGSAVTSQQALDRDIVETASLG